MKVFEGPFGSYKAGSAGAVLNAACEQENRSVNAVSNYVISDGKLYRHHADKTVIAEFRWEGDDIVFDWKTK